MKHFLVLTLVWVVTGIAQVTENDGDWTAKTVVLNNTSEAEWMVRVGDIDNLGFGWPEGFDPFSGNTTPPHGYPWTADPADPDGTDRILVVTSYVGTPPAGRDGYTTGTARPDNEVRPVVLEFDLGQSPVTNAALQLFVDDFQAPVWHGAYTVALNGRPFSEIEPLINDLAQTGPVGRLLTVAVPLRFLDDVRNGHLELLFDDLTTGAGDGYAIDFVKLLVNVKGLQQTGDIRGRVLAAGSDTPIVNAQVWVFEREAITDQAGAYALNDVPAGLAYVTAGAAGYSPQGRHVDVVAGQTVEGVDFRLNAGEFRVEIYEAVELEFFGHAGQTYVLQYSGDLETWTDDETIPGQGELVTRLRPTRPASQRYWRVWRL